MAEQKESLDELYARTIRTIKKRAQDLTVAETDRPALYRQANAAWRKYEENSSRGHWIKACYCLHVYTKLCLDFSLHRIPKSRAAPDGPAAQSLHKLAGITLERLKSVEDALKQCNRGVYIQVSRGAESKTLNTSETYLLVYHDDIPA